MPREPHRITTWYAGPAAAPSSALTDFFMTDREGAPGREKATARMSSRVLLAIPKPEVAQRYLARVPRAHRSGYLAYEIRCKTKEVSGRGLERDHLRCSARGR